MHLPPLPKNTKDLLELLRNMPATNPQELISTYTQSLSLLTDDVHSLFIFLDYINLVLSCSEERKEETQEEVDHLYSLFKVKMRRFRIFWVNYLRFQVEQRGKDFDSSFGKMVEYLKLKAFEGKEEVMDGLMSEKEVLRRQLAGGGGLPEACGDERADINSSTSSVNKDDKAVAAAINRSTSSFEVAASTADAIDLEMQQERIELDMRQGAGMDSDMRELGSMDLGTRRERVALDARQAGEMDLNMRHERIALEMRQDMRKEDRMGLEMRQDRVCLDMRQERIDLEIKQERMCLNMREERISLERREDKENKTPRETQGTDKRTTMMDQLVLTPDKRGESGKYACPKDESTVSRNHQTAKSLLSTPAPTANTLGRYKGDGPDDSIEKSILFELELSRSGGTSKLRFSPNKHAPYSSARPTVHIEKPERRRFVDIFSISQDKTYEGPAGPPQASIPFKDKELILISKIGKGGYSSVYRVSHGSEIYALKQIRAEDNESLNICLDEIDLLKRLSNCEFVIKMVDYEIRDETVNILLEYGESDLQNLIKTGPLNIFYIKYIWESVLRILVFIHSNKIVHRDIKPANFVLVKGKLKIIDFGISKSIKGDTTSILNFEKAGTLNYISPEQCSGGKVSRATDVWAAGCILYYMIYRKSVHNCRTVMDVLRMMAEESEIEFGPADAAAIESMKACLIYDSKKRAKPEELLRYSFLQK